MTIHFDDKTYALNPSLSAGLELHWRQRGEQRQRVRVDPRTNAKLVTAIASVLAVANKPAELRRQVEVHGKFLVDFGLLVEADDVPETAPEAPTLDPSLLSLVAQKHRSRVRREIRRGRKKLRFASEHVFVQRSARRRPTTDIPGIPPIGHFPRGKRLLWVHDPGTRMWAFYSLTEVDLALVTALAKRATLPAALNDKTLEVLVHANIVTSDERARGRALMWDAVSANALGTATSGWAVARNVLPSLLVANMRRISRTLHREGYFYCDEQHVHARKRDYCTEEPITGFIHRQSADLVRHITSEAVFPSWNLLSRYQGGSRLTKHIDRDQCAWNGSLSLDAHPSASEASPWPLCFEIEGRVQRVELSLGDLALYRGTRNPHWRTRLGTGRTETIMLWFFVPLAFQGDTLE
jgi:hypothetical protein